MKNFFAIQNNWKLNDFQYVKFGMRNKYKDFKLILVLKILNQHEEFDWEKPGGNLKFFIFQIHWFAFFFSTFFFKSIYEASEKFLFHFLFVPQIFYSHLPKQIKLQCHGSSHVMPENFFFSQKRQNFYLFSFFVGWILIKCFPRLQFRWRNENKKKLY